jgi:hypothetical protein
VHICEATAELIRDHGLQADPAKTIGKDSSGITLHQALRRAARLDPGAWLRAYLDQEVATAGYREVVTAMRAEADRRWGSRIEMTLWAERVSQDEVLAALAAVVTATAGGDVPDPPPRLRAGCDPKKRVATVKIGGVLVAALRAACAANDGAPVARIAIQAAEADLSNCSNDAFLAGADQLAYADSYPPAAAVLAAAPEFHWETLLVSASKLTHRIPTILGLAIGDMDTITDAVLSERLKALVEAAPS